MFASRNLMLSAAAWPVISASVRRDGLNTAAGEMFVREVFDERSHIAARIPVRV